MQPPCSYRSHGRTYRPSLAWILASAGHLPVETGRGQTSSRQSEFWSCRGRPRSTRWPGRLQAPAIATGRSRLRMMPFTEVGGLDMTRASQARCCCVQQHATCGRGLTYGSKISGALVCAKGRRVFSVRSRMEEARVSAGGQWKCRTVRGTSYEGTSTSRTHTQDDARARVFVSGPV